MSRPLEHRIALKAHVLPKTAKRIRKLRRKGVETIGRVLDEHFIKEKP